MGFFKKPPGPPTDSEAPAAVPAGPDPTEGPGKGRTFFERAATVGATGNYDYAIDMYIEGLSREPQNVAEHDKLRKVAFARKLNGGKPAGGLLGGGKLPYKGKTPKEALLNNEFTLSKDVGNIPAMLAIVRNAVLMNYKDVIFYFGPILQEANRTNKTPKKDIFVEIARIYETLEEFEKASEAVRGALDIDPTDGELVSLAKDLSARQTLKKGNYEAGNSFTGSIKDADATKKLNEEENLNKSEEYRRKAVEIAEADYLKNPKELQVINKYYKALDAMDDEESENKAIEILEKAFIDTKIYRLKFNIGDIKIKQHKRNLRMMKEAADADPDDQGTREQYEAVQKESLDFELAEWSDRALHMPTDAVIKYEYGVRLYRSKRYDEAIGALQEAQQNPKHRVDALHLLGRAFLTQGMKPEAVETLKHAIEEYDLAETGDKKAKELFYWYGRALEENGESGEAINTYSKVIRWEINYRDAKTRLAALRANAASAS